ncbi:unnamed protein product [Caretta caretta]
MFFPLQTIDIEQGKLASGATYLNEIAVFMVALLFIMFPFVLILVSYLLILLTILKMPLAQSRHKAFSTCSSHLLVVTLFYGTGIITYLCPISAYAPVTNKLLSLFYTVITPMFNPLIYNLRNKEGLRQDGHCLLALRNSDANSDNVAWTFSLPYCEPNEINYFFCDISPVLKLACGDTLRKEASILALSVLINLSPFLLVVVSYARILSRIPKTPSAEGRHKAFSTCSSHLTVVTLFYSSACAIYLWPKFNHTVEVDMLISFLFCPRSSAGPCDLQSEEQRGEECPEQTQGKKEVFMNWGSPVQIRALQIK